MNRLRLFLTGLVLLSVYTLNAAPPAGYYSSATGSGATLKTQLHDIISTGHIPLGYNELWTAFQSTDARPDGRVWDMYSDKPGGIPDYIYNFTSDQCGTYNSEADCYNREHSFPKSWWGGSEGQPMYTDLFHLYPTDGYVNNRRSNFPFGEVGSASWTSTNGSKLGTSSYPGYSGTVFEPIDEYKGDFARTYFYMATRYEPFIDDWAGHGEAGNILDGTEFPVFKSWFLNMLAEWHVQDPVSDKELARNDAVYALQGNRNPFIDDPGLVYRIWGVGQTLIDAPQKQVSNFMANPIILRWTDAVGGTLPDGYLILMSTTGFEAIESPQNGVVYPENNETQYIPYGVEKAHFKRMEGATHYFKIFPYRGDGENIVYKTDGVVPQVKK